MRIAYNFLSNVDRISFNIQPIVLIRPWEREGALVHRLEKCKYVLQRIPVIRRPKTDGSDYFRILRSVYILYRILSRGHFDLVHTHGYFADIIGTSAAQLLKIPQVSTCHGFTSTGIKLRIYNLLDMIALRFCRKAIAVSNRIRTELLDAGISPSRIQVIENAVEGIQDPCIQGQHRKNTRDLLGIGQQENLVGYIGRLSPEKGLEYLIEAISILNIAGQFSRLLIIGEGPKETQLRLLVREKDLANNVIFAGFQEKVEEWLPALDVFVLPSLTEGTPMALLEAMANGIPVVATAVGGIPNILTSNINGILVSPARPEELANGIEALLSDAAMRKRISLEAKNTIVDKYDLDTWVRKIEALYLEVMTG